MASLAENQEPAAELAAKGCSHMGSAAVARHEDVRSRVFADAAYEPVEPVGPAAAQTQAGVIAESARLIGIAEDVGIAVHAADVESTCEEEIASPWVS